MLRFWLARFVFIVLVALIAVSGARADSVVTLRPAADVDRASIMLSDVFAGLPDKIDRAIATAPAPGKSVTYDVRVLARLAEQNRLDWQPQSLADRAVLTRAATHITQDMIRAAVVNKLKEQGVKGQTEALFDNRTLDIALPSNQSPDFALNNFDYDATNRRFRADLTAKNGAAPLVVPVTGRVTIKRDVPVLAHRLEAGTLIAEADLDWKTIQDEHLAPDVITESAQIVGREMRHDTPEGQPLRGRDLIQPRLVTRGSLVVMKIETPHMLITAQGKALQDGTLGDVVRVTNTQSNRVVEGTVDGAGVVRIATAQKIASAR